jgi:hypothetical protein
MTRAIADLKRDISALSRADKEKLLDFLMPVSIHSNER